MVWPWERRKAVEQVGHAIASRVINNLFVRVDGMWIPRKIEGETDGEIVVLILNTGAEAWQIYQDKGK